MALLANNQRLCTHYDLYGRPDQTGFVSHSSPPSGNDPLPLAADQLTQTNYSTTAGITLGKVTYTKSKELGTSNFLDSWFYYDSFGRLSYTIGDNHLYSASTAERTDFTYDFADNILTQNRDHRPNSSTLTTVDETFTYDHWARPINHDHRINGGGTIRLSNNVYNSRSQLTQKNLHLTPSSYYLQNVDYTYNTLGWLTAINNFQCIDTGGGGSSSAQAPTGEGFEVEVGFDANAGGGGFQSSVPGFKVRVSGKVTTGDGGLSSQVLIEKVFGVQAGTDASFTASQLQADYGQTQLPNSTATSLSDTKITYSNMGETLLEVEEKLLDQLEQAGVDAEFGVLLINEVRRALEEAWLPISAAGFAAAEEEAYASGMAGAAPPVGGPSDDLFALKLYYNVANSTLGATAQKNGNIAYLGWQVGCNDPAFYGMQYDHLDRIKKATYADLDKNTNAYKNLDRNTVDLLGYDKRGNINRIRRRGLNYGTTYGYIDNLYLYYVSGTNKLNSVSESTGTYYKTKGFKSPTGGTKYYTHDANGNLISDGHKGISNVDYNHLNLPKKVTWSNGNWIEWTYDANGTKLKKVTSAGSTKHYINGIEYNGTTVEAIYHAEGRASWRGSGYRYEYTLRDHLGNSRVMFADLNADNEVDETEILQQNHYYPFGMNMEGMWPGGTNKYQYNGKEIDNDFGLDWYHYGARMYDPAFGRFTGVDPLASDFASWSTYAYVFNNPLIFIDPDGRSPESSDWIYDQQADGSFKRREGTANDGGANFHTYNNNDGTTLYHNVKEGTFATVRNGEAGQKVADYRAKVAKRREVVKQTGEVMNNVGDGIATVGYAAAPFTEGASLTVAAVGEGIAVTGKVITNAAKFEESGVTTENMLDLGVDVLIEVAPLPLENAVKKSNIDDVAKKVVRSEIGKVKQASEYVAKEKIEQSRTNGN